MSICGVLVFFFVIFEMMIGNNVFLEHKSKYLIFLDVYNTSKI